MEQRNNNQNSIIFEIESILNKMSNQVNFLIRKEMSMSRLDLDLLMENTRKLYDTICSVELGVRSEELGDGRDITPVVSEELGIGANDADLNIDEEVEEDEMIIDFEEDNNNDELVNFENEDEDDEDADMVWDFTKEELGVRSEELGIEEEEDSEVIEFEDENEDNEEGIIDSSDDEIVESKEEEKEEDSGIRVYRIVRDNVPTLGDMLEQSEDKSLAARLQRKPVSDLISAIGINDKFLFLNELFGGSMEKYNKAIRSLNSFSTLLGAKTYMSELQIEFQWDCNSDAYKKLADLVERRFISIHNA